MNFCLQVNERVAISVSSSPVSQVGVGVGVGVGAGEYGINSRGDRPRISLLPPASVAPAPSPTGPEYHVTGARNPRVMMPMQTDQYCSRAVEMATLLEAPPFKKIRLVQPQSQPQCQTISPVDNTCIKQEHVQLQQPLRIDTRVGFPAIVFSPRAPPILLYKTTRNEKSSKCLALFANTASREYR